MNGLHVQGAALQEARGKLQEDKEAESGDDTENGDEGEAAPNQGPVDALRAGAAGGKESAFFQDSGAVPTKLEQEEQEVSALLAIELLVLLSCRTFPPLRFLF